MSDGSGKTAWGFDMMGRTVAEERTIGTVTKTMSYGYNLDGSVGSITHPSGRVVSYTYGGDQRTISAVDTADSINYATGTTYAPQGSLASVVRGRVSGGFAGITTNNSYDSLLLPTLLSASSSNGTALSLSYTYFANGNVNIETNGRDNGRSVTYTYDALNRVTAATSQATSGSDCWGQSFGYDRYANLTTVNVTQCTAPMLSLSVNTNNQITSSGSSYDAAGDLTGDGTYTYLWNAEKLLKSAANVNYTYDGELRRVEKSSGTLYWYCAICEQVLVESDLSGNLISEYVFFNRQRIARRDVASGNVYYLFQDRLGSYRTLTDSSGNVQGESDYYPFGGERVISSTVTDGFRLGGMEWDSEDGLNHTLYRQYTPTQGRWHTPDPKRHCVMNPQGQNLYSYVLDNAANFVDPLGLQSCPPGCTFVENEGAGECQCIGTGGGGFPPGNGGPCSTIAGAGGVISPDVMGCPNPSPGGGAPGRGKCDFEIRPGSIGALCDGQVEVARFFSHMLVTGNATCEAESGTSYCTVSEGGDVTIDNQTPAEDYVDAAGQLVCQVDFFTTKGGSINMQMKVTWANTPINAAGHYLSKSANVPVQCEHRKGGPITD